MSTSEDRLRLSVLEEVRRKIPQQRKHKLRFLPIKQISAAPTFTVGCHTGWIHMFNLEVCLVFFVFLHRMLILTHPSHGLKPRGFHLLGDCVCKSLHYGVIIPQRKQPCVIIYH